jgi:tetratricopeptide (TPR) repeat protein
MAEGQWVRIGRTRLMAWHMLEDHRTELREVQEFRDSHPDDVNLLVAEIRAQAALGRVEEVAILVQEAVSKDLDPPEAARIAAEELFAHENAAEAPKFYEVGLDYLRGPTPETQTTIQDRWDVAQFLYYLRRWEEAEGIMRELLLERPDTLDLLGRWGTLLARSGQSEQARDVAARIAALETPFDLGASFYWRARIATLLGEKDPAVSLLRRAHEKGLAFQPYLHCDPDLAPLRGYAPFEEFMRPKG